MKSRLYSLFEKVDGKWIRLSNCAYKKSTAVRVYQNALLNMSLNGRIPELRVVKEEFVTIEN